MKRGRGEHGLKLLAGKQCLLKLSVDKFHLSSTFQVLPGQCHEVLAGFECCDVQAPGDKAARQLAASTPNLKHMITAPDPCDLTSLVNEFVRISRTVAVVLSRDLIKNLAVTDVQWILVAVSFTGLHCGEDSCYHASVARGAGIGESAPRVLHPMTGSWSAEGVGPPWPMV